MFIYRRSNTIPLLTTKWYKIFVWTFLFPSSGLQAIEAIEALLNAPRGAAFEEEGPLGAPQIVQDLQPVGDVEEGTAVHFEVHVEPSNDPSLAVYW